MRVEEMMEKFNKRVKSMEQKGEINSRYYQTKTQAAYFQKVVAAKDEGKTRAWVSLFVPTELFWAMDIVPFVVEQFVIQVLASGTGYQFLDAGEAYGFPKEACSPHVATIGAALSGILPPPDVMVCSGQSPCDSAAVMFENLSYVMKTPVHYATVPYYQGEEAIQEFKAELKQLIAFLEETTGNKMDYDRLRQSLENYRAAQDYFIRFHKLRSLTPSPVSNRTAFASFGVGLTCSGMPETIDFYRAQYEEAKALADLGQGAAAEERHRILFHGPPPFWYMRLVDWIEKEYGAVITADVFNHFPMNNLGDTSDPLDALARRALTCFGGALMHTAPIRATVNWAVAAAKHYGVNGAIATTHFGCKQGCSRTRPIADGLRNELGIPVLILDIDVGNPAIVSVAQMELKLDQYFRVLEQQREAWATTS